MNMSKRFVSVGIYPAGHLSFCTNVDICIGGRRAGQKNGLAGRKTTYQGCGKTRPEMASLTGLRDENSAAKICHQCVMRARRQTGSGAGQCLVESSSLYTVLC